MTKINKFLNYLIEKIEKHYKPATIQDKYREDTYQYNKEVYLLYKELEKSYKNNLNLYLYKPNVVMEQDFENIIPRLDMYKLEKEVENISIDNKYKLVESTIKLNYLNINNCIYVTFNHNNTQPITITLWCLNPEEIRIGCFLQKEQFTDERKTEIQEAVGSIVKLYDTPMFKKVSFAEKERETNILNEVIVNFEDWRTFNNKKHMLNLTGLVIVLVFSKYINMMGLGKEE